MKKVLPYIVFTIALIFAGCSTQKAKWANIQYHNTTCHYNVWWNGNESLKAGVEQLQKKHVDDYTQILSVYKLGTKEQAMTVNAQMDKAIEKGVKGIQKHSIYQHGKEYVKYVKNCYLLTAYATFYKQDYLSTTNTCHLIVSQYTGSKEADEAKILLARCMTMQKQYVDAETALDQLINEFGNGDLDPQLTDKLYMAMVECTLPQEKYKKTVQYIRLAIDETRNQTTKGRLYFILAQIYQKLDKRPTATKYFEKVLTCRPDYIMEFNARINIASCSDITHTDVAEQEHNLDKMLKDKKNEEFKDQIYYAKGEMFFGVKDAQKACDNYKLSVAAAKNNPSQKAKSALRMADVLYDVYENYNDAQSYYDTAMHIINADYPNYDEIRSRYILLTSLVEFTRVVYRNDSLLAMADMTPANRDAFIQKKIAELKQKEQEAQEQKLLEELKNDARSQANTLEGDWYFYSHNTVNKGKETFQKRWGNRILEDYWFLSKKGTLGLGMIPMSEMENDEADSDSTVSDSIKTVATLAKANDDPKDPHCVAYYLKDLPKTQGQRDTMHADIAQSLLNAGYIYYDGIKNTDRALECYLRMANDYPDNNEIVQAFYQLYRIYSKQGNTPSANYYRDMVLMGFPDCDYANLIRDDQYYLEIIHRTELSKEEYATVYSLYHRRRYTDVLEHTQQAIHNYNDENLVGKFKYWRGLAWAQTGCRDSAMATFENILATNSDTAQIYVLAQEQLAYFKQVETSKTFADKANEEITAADEVRIKGGRYGEKSNPTQTTAVTSTVDGDNDSELPIASQMFRYRENMQHYVIIIINDKKIIATQLQYKIADFNSINYSNSGYRSSPLMFTDSTQMLTIYQFKNADEAMTYYTHILIKEGPLQQYNPQDYIVFAISTQNYRTFYNRKDIESYKLFFEKYYKK